MSLQIRDFLEWQGWRILRCNVTKVKDRTGRWTSYGEVGMPDFLCLYYPAGEKPGVTIALWLEVKKAKGKPRPEQVAWHTAETERGGCVYTADQLESFKLWYWSNFSWLSQRQQPLFS